MRRYAVLLALPLLLAGCGSDGPAQADTDTCTAQAEDLADARATATDLSDGTGQIQTARPALQGAVGALAAYTPEGERLTTAVENALTAVTDLADDVEDQRITTTVVATAQSRLDALDDVCAELSA